MLNKTAQGLLLALAFLHGHSANAVPRNHDSQHLLELNEAGAQGNALVEHPTTLLQQSKQPPVKAAEPYRSEAIPRDLYGKPVCDSEDTAQKRECKKAIDFDLNTFWQTKGGSAKMPHNITVELKKEQYITGIGIFPRQDREMEGAVAAHEVYLSLDGKNWDAKPVAFGTWWGKTDPEFSQRFANFEPQLAKFVCLKATSEVNGGASTSIAELIVYRALYTPPSSKPSDPSKFGKWGPTIDFPLVPAGAWVEPTTGKLITFSSAAPHDSPGDRPPGTRLAKWDPKTTIVSDEKGGTKHDMFCPGMSFDAEGRMWVTGGKTEDMTSVYDFNEKTKTWSEGPKMKIARGYQASTICADGKIFIIGGSWNGAKGGNPGKIGEYYDPKTKKWERLDDCPVKPMLTDDWQDRAGREEENDPDYVNRGDNHGWLFGWKDNTVFQAGPSKSMNWYTVSGPRGGWKEAGVRLDDKDAMCGTAVMYDAPAGKILTAGGATDYQCSNSTTNSFIITLGNANATVSVVKAGEMRHNRMFHNAIILPNGNTFVTGGQQIGLPFSDSTPQLVPEMYSPSGTGSWTDMAPNSIVRAYHSIGLLLPDATVFVGGAGLCGKCNIDKCKQIPAPDNGSVNNHFDGQIYTPSYLFDPSGGPATRPEISDRSPVSVRPGGIFEIKTSSEIITASLIRYGSTTHGLNTDQRRIPLTPKKLREQFTYQFSIPENNGVVTPGYWMLFVLNFKGVPSVAKPVKVLIAGSSTII